MNNIDKILVFDVWGDYAHFRKPYTTTSPLTYPFPPRTAICGLIGAIIGLSKENNEYLKYFSKQDAFIGIKLLMPIKKTRIAQNLIKTADSGMFPIKTRTQIKYELIKDPKYRIYFYHTNNQREIYTELKNKLEEHKSCYTPCLGLSEHIANFQYIDEYSVESLINNFQECVEISTIMPKSLIKIDNFEDGEYFSCVVPNEMQTDRSVTEYLEVIFERNCKPIKVLTNSYFKVIGTNTNENIMFL